MPSGVHATKVGRVFHYDHSVTFDIRIPSAPELTAPASVRHSAETVDACSCALKRRESTEEKILS